MSEQRNDNRTDCAMSPEELARYRELLSAAYPYEKGKIASSVTAKIAAEGRRRKAQQRRRAVIRWGSVAAAIVLICTVCISLMPRLSVYEKGDEAMAEDDMVNVSNSSSETSAPADHADRAESMDNAEDMDESIAGDFESPQEGFDPPSSNGTLFFEDENALISLTAITEDGAEFDDAESLADVESPSISTESSDNAYSENESVGEEPEDGAEYAVTRLLMFSAAPSTVSTVTECTHSETFMNSYHEIPAVLVNLVGNEEYTAWESGAEDESCVNIADFIEYFGISREIFTELVMTSDLYYAGDYPIELLFGGDAAAIESYYSAGGDFDGCLARYFEYKFKLALGDAVENYNSWRSAEGYTSVATWSIAQLVRDLDVEREELEVIYSSVIEEFLSVYADAEVCEYDFDAIMECGEEIRRAIVSGKLGYEIDAIYRK